MVLRRGVRRLAVALVVLTASATFLSATALADDLADYRWERRPLLVFAPSDRDPRLGETLSRIQATRCEFDRRDMVVGSVVAKGDSTLDGHVLDADQAPRLRNQYGIDLDAFAVLLIGKDGDEKWRVNAIPDLQAVYAVIDGMPMRSREMDADRSGC